MLLCAFTMLRHGPVSSKSGAGGSWTSGPWILTMTSVLPPFLHAHEPRQHDATSRPYTEATFKHSAVPNTAFALWWPGADTETTPDVVILFIPGASSSRLHDP
jgi:hypothetical protein